MTVHTFLRTSIAVLVPLMFFASLAMSQTDIEQAKKDISAAVEGIAKAAQARDFAAMDKFFTPDATIIDSSGETRWSVYKEAQLKQQLATMGRVVHSVTTTNVTVWENTAVASFDFVQSAKPTALSAALKQNIKPAAAALPGGEVAIIGKGTVVFRRINGEWKAVHVQSAGRPMTQAEATKFKTQLLAQ
jgi:ketosteroid isomerase-like protein